MLTALGVVNYSSHVLELRQTSEFRDWLDGLADSRAAARIAQRLVRLESGLFGDARFFEGIGELKVDYGPGYRIYFVRQGEVVILLLWGGDKSTQKRDIMRAKRMAKEI